MTDRDEEPGDRPGGPDRTNRFGSLLRRVSDTWLDRGRIRAVAFGLVGLSGFLPNLGVLQLLTIAGVHYVPATIAATEVAILWNFVLLDRFVYRHVRRRRVVVRLARFLALNNADLVLRIPLLALLVRDAHLTVLTGTVITLVLASAVRFVVTDRFLYAGQRRPKLPDLRQLSDLPVPSPVPALPTESS